MPASRINPSDAILKGIKTVWDANGTLSGIPISRAPKAAGDTSFPYCIITPSDVDDDGWTTHRTYFEGEVEFRVYHRTPELASAELDKIIAVFSDESLEIPLSVGSVWRWRLGPTRNRSDDRMVWFVSATYEFGMSTEPRVNV